MIFKEVMINLLYYFIILQLIIQTIICTFTTDKTFIKIVFIDHLGIVGIVLGSRYTVPKDKKNFLRTYVQINYSDIKREIQFNR